MSASSTVTGHATPQTLATATLPRRVRRVLEHLLNAASDELERHLDGVLSEFEQQLFRLADHARNPGIESTHLQTLRTLRLNRADLVPHFMAGLEASLAILGRGPRGGRDAEARDATELPRPQPGRGRRPGRGGGPARDRGAPGIARQPAAAPARASASACSPGPGVRCAAHPASDPNSLCPSCASPRTRCRSRWRPGCCSTAFRAAGHGPLPAAAWKC